MAAQIFKNRLLSALEVDDLQFLAPHLELVSFKLREPIIEPHRTIPFVHFLESGFMSVLVDSGGRHQVEIGMIGFEGLSGLPVLLGCVDTALRVVVQRPGAAFRIPSSVLWRICNERQTLRATLLRYAEAFCTQVAGAARSHANFLLHVRLARWILMAHDRTDGDDVVATHDLVAQLLSVRRPGVSVAMHIIEGHRFIKSVRSCIRVLDCRGLEGFAGSSYGAAEAEFDRLLPPTSPAPDDPSRRLEVAPGTRISG